MRKEIKQSPYEQLEANIDQVKALASEKRGTVAFVMSWAGMEAIGRAIFPLTMRKPQSPATLIDVFAAHSLLRPTEAERLRALIQVRNRIVHGALDEPVEADDLSFMTMLMSRMLNEVPRDWANSADIVPLFEPRG